MVRILHSLPVSFLKWNHRTWRSTSIFWRRIRSADIAQEPNLLKFKSMEMRWDNIQKEESVFYSSKKNNLLPDDEYSNPIIIIKSYHQFIILFFTSLSFNTLFSFTRFLYLLKHSSYYSCSFLYDSYSLYPFTFNLYLLLILDKEPFCWITAAFSQLQFLSSILRMLTAGKLFHSIRWQLLHAYYAFHVFFSCLLLLFTTLLSFSFEIIYELYLYASEK